jgi:hypothetical protein
MENKIIISEDVILEDALHDLISSIKSAVDAEIYIEHDFVVTCDNPVVLAALSALFGKRVSDQTPKRKKIQRNIKKRLFRIWTITGGNAPVESIGTKLTSLELSEMLSEKRLPIGTELTHSKKGKVIVAENGNADTPHKLLRESGEPL